MTPEDRLIIALDRPSVESAQRVVDAIGSAGRFYKIGYQLIPIGGLQLAERLSASGRKVFLD
ncbi:MAG: orotidine 5'-phosphate decarboxylase / HUMPS family protein, partial [Pseudomonadota bacterium]